MAVDDFESAFEEALAAETLEPSDTLGTDRNATIHQGDEELTATDAPADSEEIGSELEPIEDGPADTSGTEEFDWQEHKDRLVKVKVDGEEIAIPLAEAMSSYMRQADYTKKTQALAEDKRMAEWAREMRSAIQNDPAGTVQALQRALGLAENDEPDLYADLDPELQPMVAQMQAQQKQIDQFQQMMVQQREAQVFSEVQAEVASVRAKYADFDATKVLPLAAERGLTILEAYKLVKADEFLDQESRHVAAQAAAAAKAAAAAQKKAAADKVARGGSASGTAQEQIVGDTFAEMLEHRLQLANS